jgi:hypothetical protein
MDGISLAGFLVASMLLPAGVRAADAEPQWQVRENASVALMGIKSDHKGWIDLDQVIQIARDGASFFIVTEGSAASGNKGDLVQRYDTASGKKRFSVDPKEGIALIRLSPDERWLAVALASGQILLLDAGEGKIQRRLKWHAAPVSAISFSQDSARLVSGDVKGSLALWEVSRGRQVAKKANATRGYLLACLAFSPDGRSFASQSRSYDAITIWGVDKSGIIPVQTVQIGASFDEVMPGGMPAPNRLLWPEPDRIAVLRGDFPFIYDPIAKKRILIVGYSSRLPENEVPKAQCVLRPERRNEELGVMIDAGLSQVAARRVRYEKPARGGDVAVYRLTESGLGNPRSIVTGEQALGLWFREFSPDGRLIATDERGSLCLRSVASGRRVWRFEAPRPKDARHEVVAQFVGFRDGGKVFVTIDSAISYVSVGGGGSPTGRDGRGRKIILGIENNLRFWTVVRK